MKKYLLGFMLLLATLSFNAFSGNQVCYPTGPNQWTCIEYYTPGNLGAFGPPGSTVNNGMTTNSTTYSNEAYAAKQAAESAANKAEAEAKKKYCKDNNYPTSAPFCAAQKEAKNKCLADSVFTSRLCENDTEAERTQRVEACFVIDDVDAAQICHTDANKHATLRIKGCKEDKAVDDQWCESKY